MTETNFFSRVTYFNLIQFVLAIVCAGLILWISDKCLMLPDEGLYYAYLNPHIDNYHSLFNYDLIFKILYRYTKIEIGIWESRLLRFFLLLLLFVSLLPLFKRLGLKLHEKIFLLFTLFGGYGLMPQSLSYYTLCLILAVLYFLFFYYSETFKKIFYLNYILLGFICSLSYTVKPPFALLLFVLLQFRILLFAFQNKYSHLIWGFILSNLSFWLFQFWLHYLFPHYSFWNVIEDGRILQSFPGQHNGLYIIKLFLSSFQWTLVLIGAGFVLGYKKIKFTKINISIRYLISVLLISVFIIKHWSSNRFGLAEYSITSSSLVVLGYLFSDLNYKNLSHEKILIFILLFTMPFILIIGSNIYFFRIGQYYSFFWWLLVLYLSKETNRLMLMVNYLYLLLSSLVIYNIYLNHIKWRINNKELLSKNVSFNYSSNKPIYISADQKKYFSKLKNKLKQYSNSTNKSKVIGIYEPSGEVLFCGADIFYNPLYVGTHNLWAYFTYVKSDKEYKSIFPLIITKDIDMAKNDLSNYYDSQVLDSIPHWGGGKMYIIQTFKLERK